MSYFLKRMLERQDGVDDLCMIGSISDSAIASQLKTRLEKKKIYANIKDTLIAVNPYKMLPIYGDDMIRKYQCSNLGSDVEPHVYLLAEKMYRRMAGMGESQAVIISGESGAGKTETAKLILNYVSCVSGSSHAAQRTKSIINDCNPILESFGNAKTVRNDNSSRFGKFLEVEFNANAEPVGGVTTNFLLEKTRVAYQQAGERNFHIFYQLLAGAEAWPDLKEACSLSGPENFLYTCQSGVTTVEGKDDYAMFKETSQAMDTIGMDAEMQWYIWQALAGILHLGNVGFEGDYAPCNLSQNSDYFLRMAAHLFCVSDQDLQTALLNKTIKMGGRRSSVVEVPQNADQATQIRDALAKELYSRIFDMIVAQINKVMRVDGQQRAKVAILDIYGFEVFDNNSFEQFCINYVNERLQQIFIDLAIRSEQEEYRQEGIPWKDIKFFDNLIVCDLIDSKNPPGVMRILDDTCRKSHAEKSDKLDWVFADALQKAHTGHPHLAMNVANGMFMIRHYAGDVKYTIDGFCFKNVDSVFHSLITMMQTSQSGLIKSLWPDNTQGKAPATSSTKIRMSSQALIKSLRACTPHYVRCIKPNDKKAPLTMNMARTEFQVTYLGLKENVKVAKSGYSYRSTYEEFVHRFYLLNPADLCDGGPRGCRQLIDYIVKTNEFDTSEFGFGKTKIFVKSPQTIFILEELREEKVDPEGYAIKKAAYEQQEQELLLEQRKKGHRGGQKTNCSIS